MNKKEKHQYIIDKQKWIAKQNDEAEFIWGHFFKYCKAFYAEGGVYGDEVHASDFELEVAICDVLDRFDHEFEGDSYDRELVRHYIEQNRAEDNARLIFRAVHQSMEHDLIKEKELV
jgi:hypothetical protein